MAQNYRPKWAIPTADGRLTEARARISTHDLVILVLSWHFRSHRGASTILTRGKVKLLGPKICIRPLLDPALWSARVVVRSPGFQAEIVQDCERRHEDLQIEQTSVFRGR